MVDHDDGSVAGKIHHSSYRLQWNLRGPNQKERVERERGEGRWSKVNENKQCKYTFINCLCS